MSTRNTLKINTKLKAYRLIHDSNMVHKLLYSKYGDIEEDLYLYYINQLVYEKPSHYNFIFKEFQFSYDNDEYLKRFYKKYEIKPRIPKLCEYYKNYYLFFCRPNFKDLVISELMEDYYDDKAEVYYKNNFENSITNNEEKEEIDRHNSESLSSLDNITDNKIIFTKKTKKIIDKNLDPNCGTLTLTSNSINNINNDKNYNGGLISRRSINDSFEKIVHNLIHYKKNKIKLEKNKQINVQSKKKINNKVGGNYTSKKINKNLIISLNINNNSNNGINGKIFKNQRNKNSLFSLLKSNNIINSIKTDNNNTNNLNEKLNNINLTINSNKLSNKNKTNFTSIICSPKNKKVHKIHLISKLEVFHNNLSRPNTSFHHKRNKTVYFSQNQMTSINNNQLNTINNNNNHINTFSNNLSKKNNLKNNMDDLKILNFKQYTQFNNFLTININKFFKNKKVIKEMKNRLKNKTFEVENFHKNIVKKISKENLIINNRKNKIKKNYNSNDINNNLKKNKCIRASNSKLNLIKNLKNFNNKININNNIKKALKNFKPKFSSLNCLRKNLNNNNIKKIGLHKKNKTTILSNILRNSPKNRISSPISKIKQKKKFYNNINKSENITSKIKPKISKNKVNNLNINFNNIILNAPLSNVSENINYNNNFINNTNSNTSYKLLTPTSNDIYFNNTFNNNITNNSNHIDNKIYLRVPQNERINYITNLKNFCNFSRNKLSSYRRTFSQTDDNYSIIKQNNIINGKIIYGHNKNNNNTYSNLYTNEKQDTFKKNRKKIIIPKPISKKINLKKSIKKKSNQIKKTKKIESRNKKIENEINNYGLTEVSTIEKMRIINDTYREIEENIKLNKTNNLFSSPKTSGRIFTIQSISKKKDSNLAIKKIIKSNQRIKLK